MYIRRPCVILAMVYISGTICAMADNQILTITAGLVLLFCIGTMISRNKVGPAYLFLFLLFLFSYGITLNKITPKHPSIFYQINSSGIKASILGTIDSIELKETYYQILVCENSIRPKNYDASKKEVVIPASGILIYMDASEGNTNDLLPGDRVLINGTLKEFDIARNQGNFNSREFYKAYNINYRCNADHITLIENGRNEISRFVYYLKNNLKKTYAALGNEKDSALFTSIVLGDRTELKEEVSNLYRDSGIAHLLAVSGLNFSMLGFGIYKIIRKAGLSFLTSTIISSSTMIIYGLMAGDGASVIRALIMFILSISAGIFGRTYDVASATAIAAVMIISDSPYMLINSGFLLSFSAVVGIIYLYPVMNRIFLSRWEEYKKAHPAKNKVEYGRRISSYLFYSVSLSISIDLVNIPIILYFFYQYPLYSILINLILVPLMTIVMISAVVAGLCGMFWLQGGIFLIGISHYILLFYDFVCSSFLKLPYSLLTIGKPRPLQLLLYYMLLISCSFFIHRYLIYIKKRNKTSHLPQILILILIPVLMFLISFKKYEKLEITMLDVGQGESICIKTPKNQIFLIDSGSTDVKNIGKYRVVPWLKSKGRNKIDYAMISHMDSDHINGILEILQNEKSFGIHIQNIVVADLETKSEKYISFINEIKKYSVHVIYMKKGNRLESEEFFLESLHPSGNSKEMEENDNSMVLSLKYKNFDMLFTGDISSEVEELLLKEFQLPSYDILKVAHHGSKYSTSTNLLKVIKPNYAIISNGIDNSYGHPHKELIERLNQANISTFNTSQTGEISIYTDGNSMRIENFIKTKS